MEPTRREPQVVHEPVPGERRPQQRAQALGREHVRGDDRERGVLAGAGRDRAHELTQRAPRIGEASARRDPERGDEQRLERQRRHEAQLTGDAEQERDAHRLARESGAGSRPQAQAIALRVRAECEASAEVPAGAEQPERQEGEGGAERVGHERVVRRLATKLEVAADREREDLIA